MPGAELPSTGEVPGKERQHEQTEVPREPGRFLVGEVRSDASNLDRHGRSRSKGEGPEPPARRAGRLVVTAREKLFP